MKKYSLFLALLVAFLFVPTPAHSQNAITLGVAQTENEFPQRLIFTLPVSSNAGDIVSAKLVIRTPQQFSYETDTNIEIPVTPAPAVDLRYEYFAVLPPSAPILYFWEVTDNAGNSARTQDILIRYDDVRYDWNVLENEEIAVWWHDRSNSFGQEVFDIAARSVKEQRTVYQADLEYQVRIIIYNSFDEFAGWQPNAAEWIGGQAFTDYGITVQIVNAFGSQSSWLNDVVPHEVSHLYFAQVTYNATAPTPTWLDEGTAQYNEFGSQSRAISAAQTAARNGDLISLSTLARGFGTFNEDRVRLAYDEAVSAVTYAVETYGETGLANLLAAYKNGMPTDEAFPEAFGVTFGEFEAGWATWLGATADTFQTPTPWALPTFPASPTPNVVVQGNTATPSPATATPSSEATPTTAPLPTAVPTSTPLIQEVGVEEVNPPSVTLAPEQSPNFTWGIIIAVVMACLCLLLLLVLVVGIWLYSRRQKTQA